MCARPFLTALSVLLLLGAAHAAPPAQALAATEPAPPKPPPCEADPDSLAAWVPATFDAALLIDLAGLRRALPKHGDEILRDHLLEPLARAGFPVDRTRRLALSFRPYVGEPDAGFGVAEGPDLEAALRAWAGEGAASAPAPEAVFHGEHLGVRVRKVGDRFHFSLAAAGSVLPLLPDDLSTRPEESLATRHPCMGDPETLYSLRVRRQRPRRKQAATEDGKPSGPLAWVRDYHLDLRTHGQGLESVGHFEIQMPLRGFFWPLFGHVGMQAMQGRIEGCGEDLADDPAGAWIDTISYSRTDTGVQMRRVGPAREFDAAIPGLRRIVRGEVGCSQRALPAALRSSTPDNPENIRAHETLAPPVPPGAPTPGKPKAPRGWLW